MKNYLTKKQMAKALGIGVSAFNQQYISKKWCKAHNFKYPNSTLTSKVGRETTYSPKFLDAIKAYRSNSKPATATPKKKTSTAKATLKKSATLTVKVSIHSQAGADLLLKRFGSEAKLSTYLTKQLEELYKPILAKRAELEAKYQKDLAALESKLS
jgi:hypothetical protein